MVKEYIQAHKDEINKNQNEYRAENRDELNKKRREKYAEKKRLNIWNYTHYFSRNKLGNKSCVYII